MSNLCLISGEDVSKRIPIAKKFEKIGYRTTIMGSEDSEIFQKNNIPYTSYSLEREFDIAQDYKTVKELKSIFQKTNFNIIHTFDTKPNLLVPYALRNRNKQTKIIRTITGLGRIFSSNSAKNKVLRQVFSVLQKQIASAVDHTVFQNEMDYQLFLDKKFVSPHKASIIKSSGIDLTEFKEDGTDKVALKAALNIDPAAKTFILISRLVKQKGVLEYLKAARILTQQGQRYNFLLVGPLDTKKDAIPQSTIEEYSDIVQYLGRRSDIKALLSISDIFVLPTYYREGVPRVLLEAAAMGLGLITTNMPGCTDVVKPNWNGFLVRIKAANELARAMEYLAEDATLLAYFRKNNKNHIHSFSLPNIATSYHKLYQSLLGATGRKSAFVFG